MHLVGFFNKGLMVSEYSGVVGQIRRSSLDGQEMDDPNEVAPSYIDLPSGRLVRSV